jgi:uncharacterized CHY-type Zn-finger protein
MAKNYNGKGSGSPKNGKPWERRKTSQAATARAEARMPELEQQETRMGALGLCQACGVEWGSCHVSLQATVLEQYRTRITNQQFWLCQTCRERLMTAMQRGDGQAERVAWSLTLGCGNRRREAG